jgi:hypothetical protein
MDREKRELRELKRTIKRAGNKRRRRQLKRDVIEHPEEAASLEADFGRYRSADLNGIDRDATRRSRREQ